MESIEKRIELKLKDGVKRQGGLALKLWPISFTGLPDRMVLLPGARIDFIELKDLKEGPSPRQLYVHRQLRELGFNVFTLNTDLAVENYLTSIQQL